MGFSKKMERITFNATEDGAGCFIEINQLFEMLHFYLLNVFFRG